MQHLFVPESEWQPTTSRKESDLLGGKSRLSCTSPVWGHVLPPRDKSKYNLERIVFLICRWMFKVTMNWASDVKECTSNVEYGKTGLDTESGKHRVSYHTSFGGTSVSSALILKLVRGQSMSKTCGILSAYFQLWPENWPKSFSDLRFRHQTLTRAVSLRSVLPGMLVSLRVGEIPLIRVNEWTWHRGVTTWYL